jgi:hypothetical protein
LRPGWVLLPHTGRHLRKRQRLLPQEVPLRYLAPYLELPESDLSHVTKRPRAQIAPLVDGVVVGFARDTVRGQVQWVREKRSSRHEIPLLHHCDGLG